MADQVVVQQQTFWQQIAVRVISGAVVALLIWLASELFE